VWGGPVPNVHLREKSGGEEGGGPIPGWAEDVVLKKENSQRTERGIKDDDLGALMATLEGCIRCFARGRELGGKREESKRFALWGD